MDNLSQQSTDFTLKLFDGNEVYKVVCCCDYYYTCVFIHVPWVGVCVGCVQDHVSIFKFILALNGTSKMCKRTEEPSTDTKC